MTQAGPRVKQRQMRIVGQISTHVRLKDMYRDVYVLDTSAVERQTQQWFSDTVTCCTFINRFVKASVIPLYAHPDSHQTKACVNTFTPHAAPHPSARLQPCQIAHIRNTFSHSFLSPLATSSALASASLLCSRKTWTAQSISLHLRLTALAPPLPQLFRNLQLHPCRLLHCPAIEPVHHRFVITSDFHLDPFALSWYQWLPCHCYESHNHCILLWWILRHHSSVVRTSFTLTFRNIHRICTIPRALLFRHEVVVRHRRIARRAIITGTSTSREAQTVVFYTFSAFFSALVGSSTFRHRALIPIDVLFLCSTHPSPAFILGQRVSLIIWVSHLSTLITLSHSMASKHSHAIQDFKN